MEDNPYFKMAEGRSETTRPALRMGVVTSAAPLVVQAGGIALTGADLYVNRLLLGYGEPVSLLNVAGTLNAVNDCPECSMSRLEASGGTLSTSISHGLGLAAGDTVALLTADDQTYVVLCRVVKMG